ncbi:MULTISPECIES: MBL fold metallo-hydrolase [Bacillus]|uniref:MBL fold metallo-hydrolase n=1 Tax=Bacillus TaxID=1386 RepID=UPI003979D80B
MYNKKIFGFITVLCTLLMLSACASTSQSSNTGASNKTKEKESKTVDLKITTYNPQEKGIFPVTSNIIEGPNEVILVDAQFQKNDADKLVQMIKATKKKLTTVYISHQDPDYYFGLSEIKKAFPNAKIVATPATVKGIKSTIQLKNDYWNPILGKNAPETKVVPDVLEGKKLTVDGESVNIIGLEGPDPARTFLWIPSKKTVLGGIPVFNNMHVWIADTQTQKSRDNWRASLDQILELKPEHVIPGHYLGKDTNDISGVAFTRDYIAKFEKEAKVAKNSTELIKAMEKAYPVGGKGNLETSAKVIKGEMRWP